MIPYDKFEKLALYRMRIKRRCDYDHFLCLPLACKEECRKCIERDAKEDKNAKQKN